MTELAIHEAQKVGSVAKVVPPSIKPRIKQKEFEKIILKLYEAIINKKGLFAKVTMETHAPQILYYPGSPHVKNFVPTAVPLHSLFDEEDDEDVGELVLRLLEKVKEPQPDDAIRSRYPNILAPGTLEHRRWLWFTTLTDRREKSEMVYPAHCYIYVDHPEFYNDGVYNTDSVVFRKALRKGKYKVGSPNQSAGNWLICAFTLFTRFGGDPVLLLKHAGWSVEKVYAWKKKERKRLGYDPIPGWGRKLISLYFLYLEGLGYVLPEDAFASDVHAQAIPLQANAVDYGDSEVIYSSPFAEMIRKAATALCKKKNYDIILVAHASWLLGSQLCTKCAGNPDVPRLCPIYEQCKGRIDTSWYFSKGKWPKAAQIMTKGGERPKFGIPTDVQARLRTTKRGKTQMELADILPLFPDRSKVIPIIPISAK